MIIRKATLKDFENFSRIKKEFIKEYGISERDEKFFLEEFNRYLKKIFFLVEETGEIAGYIMGEIEENPYENFGYISEIFVKKEHRGKEIATKLKEEFFRFLKEKGIRMCRIEVRSNNPAFKLYERWGFKINKYVMSCKI